MIYKTPGIYHTHQIAYPPLSGRLAPGIPAILGYTKQAVGEEGDLTFVPTLLNTWEAFEAQFGGPFPVQAEVGYDPQGNIAFVTLGERFFLWESVRLYFENGGREMYIVSVGNYSSVPKREDFERGLDALLAEELPSHVLMPDSVLLGLVDLGQLQAYALQHCADHQHRFAILDLKELHSVAATIGGFRDQLHSPRLDLGAAYYPWIRTGHALAIDPERIQYHALVYKDGMEKATATLEQDRQKTAVSLERDLQKAEDWPAILAGMVEVKQGPKGNMTLTTQTFSPLLDHLAGLAKRLKALDESTVAQDLSDYLGFARSLVLGMAGAGRLGSLPPALAAYIGQQRKSKLIRTAIANVVGTALQTNVAAATGRVGMAETDYEWLAMGPENWLDEWPGGKPGAEPMQGVKEVPVIGKEANLKARMAEPVPVTPRVNVKEVAASVVADKAHANAVTALAKAYAGLFEAAKSLNKGNDQVPESVKAEALRRLSGMIAWLPPSGAVAGLYATTDRERGPFKAPANASLHAVLDVGHRLTLPQQEDMNVSPDGKAVNALLVRPGRGVVVNAARTCDANSREWRYVPVRRYMLSVERAVRSRMQDYVFATNDAQLWANVKSMLAGFCNQQFRSGALAGNFAEDAYFIAVGLGETMTAQDITEGRLIVKIGLAVARPAEFIVLLFVHHMESDRLSIQV